MIENKRYSRSIFIPVKVGFKFVEVLKYCNWVHMLNKAKNPDANILPNLSTLFDLLLQIR